jgi:hypothetical protein
MVKHADPSEIARILSQQQPQIHRTPQQQRVEGSLSRTRDIQRGNFPSRGSLQFDLSLGRRHQSPSSLLQPPELISTPARRQPGNLQRDFSSQPREEIMNSHPDKSSQKPGQQLSRENEIRPAGATSGKDMGPSLVLEEVNPLFFFNRFNTNRSRGALLSARKWCPCNGAQTG